MIKKLAIVLFLGLVLSPWAESNPLSKERTKEQRKEKKIKDSTLKDQDFYQLLTTEAEKHILTLEKDVLIFNYLRQNYSTVPYLSPSDPRHGRAVYQNAQHFFWEPEKVRNAFDFPTWFGDGVYLATDPLVSRNYGGSGAKEWIGYAVRLPKGTRLLHIDQQAVFSDDDLEITLKKNHHCSAKNIFQLFQANTDKIDATHCRVPAKEMLRQLNVAGVAYRFHADKIIKEEYCKNTRELAVYYTQESPPDDRDVIAFNSQLPPQNQSDEASDLRNAIQNLAHERGLSSFFWPNLQRESIDLKEWTAENLLDCGMN